MSTKTPPAGQPTLPPCSSRGYFYLFVFDHDPAPLPVTHRYKNAFVFKTKDREAAAQWIAHATARDFEVNWGRTLRNPIAVFSERAAS